MQETEAQTQTTNTNIAMALPRIDSILIKVYFYPGEIVRKVRVPLTTTFSQFSDQIRRLVEDQESSLWVKGTSTKLSCCVCGDNQETEWFNLSNERQWRNVVDVTRLLNETRFYGADGENTTPTTVATAPAADQNYPDQSAERFLRVRAVGVLARVVPLSAPHFFAPLVGNLHRMKASWSEKLQPLFADDEPQPQQQQQNRTRTTTRRNGGGGGASTAAIEAQEGKFVLLNDLDPTFFVPLDNDDDEVVEQQQEQEQQEQEQIQETSVDVDCCSTQLSSQLDNDTRDQELIEDDDDDEEEEVQQQVEEEEQEVFKYDKELELLEQMGIPASENVKRLLMENGGNLPRVVSAYLELSFNANM